MRFRFIGVLLVYWNLVLPNSVAPANAAPPDLGDPSIQEQVRKLVQTYVDSERVVGVSVGLICDGKTLTVHAGKTAADGPGADDHTVYEIGSISKVFTGVLLADAVVQGKVKLDQPMAQLLPAGSQIRQVGDKPITLRDLATHRSGLPRLADNMVNIAGENPYADYTSKLALEFLQNHQPTRAPGEKMEYSNFATSLLGFLLCNQQSVSYDQLLHSRISGPLMMQETTVTEDANVLKRLAQGHRSPGNSTSTWEFADMPGAGGIRSSIADMMRFAQANLDPPNDAIGKAIELAWQQHQPSQGDAFAMGLGWHLARDGQTRWHNGQTAGFHSMLMVNRNIPAAVVVLSNTAVLEIDVLGEDFMRMLAGSPVKPKQIEEQVRVPVEKMQKLEGRYQLAPTFIFDVKVNDGKLMVGVTNQPTFQVYPKSETEWFYKVVPASLVFKADSKGDFNQLELLQNGVRQTAKRIAN
ncbi:beta-lactamase family protein [Stieleria sp. TO1_6]|uniref:serine hydrolase domain-containing protein n=1 Tax=Stieleria tagensis TaxID=2956795 RepID=UPI00209B6D65|nr:serine hydrolase domain-containing protein [Stieleria tagensis]MCO8121913.1 beta-lactamase family protein [Stieleria tagensis]